MPQLSERGSPSPRQTFGNSPLLPPDPGLWFQRPQGQSLVTSLARFQPVANHAAGFRGKPGAVTATRARARGLRVAI